MPENFDVTDKKNGKRKKCYYEFSKDYPGTRYDKNKHSSTGEALEARRRLRKIFTALLFVLVFVLSYFVVYTVIKLSHEPVAGLDDIGKTTKPVEVTTVMPEEQNGIIKEETTQEETTQEETTQTEEYYQDMEG